MRKTAYVIMISITMFCLTVSAEEVKKERQIKETVSPFVKTEKKIHISSYYEYSWIKQGSRKGNWEVLSNRIAYLRNNLQAPYLEISRFERFGLTDYTADIGSYFKFNDAYARAEVGFGDEISYVYRFQTTLEYSRRLIGNSFWKLNFRYLNYSPDSVFISSPGLIHYFGDHFVSLDYGNSITQNRGSAHWGIAKGNFALNKRLRVWAGSAVGERLYDINAIKASLQYGYIIFSGLDFNLSDDIDLRVGGSYSKERPDFIKRSIDLNFSIKF